MTRFHRPRFAPVLVAVFGFATAPLSAQETAFAAPRIDDVFTAADGLVRVQCGERVYVCDPAAKLPWTPTATIELPADAEIYDHDGRLAAVRPDGCYVDGVRVRAEGLPAVPGRRPPPLRAPLFLGRDRLVAPDSRGVAVTRLSAPESAPTFVPATRRESGGYGLAGRLVTATSWPHVFALDAADASPLVIGAAGRFFVRRAAEPALALGSLDLDDASAVQGFPAATAPFLAPAPRGAPALVRVDPARGLVAVYGGLDAPAPPPPAVRLLGGPCLAAAPCRLPDGAPGIYALTTPPLTPARQLAALVAKKLSVSALLYRMTEAGPGASPAARADFELPVALLIRDGDRDARVAALVGPHPAGYVLMAEPGRPARRFDGEPGGTRESALGATPAGEWVEPLKPVAARGRLLAVLRTPTGDRLLAY